MLKLDYDSLQKHLDQSVAGTPSAFMELPTVPMVIDFEDRTGASMRVHLKGDVPDVLALSRGFWNSK